MAGERFDYSNERRRHEQFIGRVALLARLDALLVDDCVDRWVVVTGGEPAQRSVRLASTHIPSWCAGVLPSSS